MKEDCYIFDLDGTLANGNGRDFYNPKDVEIVQDLQIKPVVNIVKSLKSSYKIIFLSGRENKFYEPTKEWIEYNLEIINPELFMRTTGDQRKDSVIKLELFKDKIELNYNVLGVFDDRMQVCRMWYDQGIFCFNVNQGLIEF